MSPVFRFAILSAVSSEKQARDDKASLADQTATARSFGLSQGGTESAGPYILDGYSRTGYVDLTLALANIPPLGECIRDAEQNKYDVLIVDNVERFGDLAQMIYTRFKQLKKQIVSARQPTPIHDPLGYNPRKDAAGGILMHVEGIIQDYRLDKMRRGWELGVPARITRGLHPLAPPFGYRSTDSSLPAEQVPAETRLLCHMKDMLLSGDVYEAIMRYAEASGVPPPRARWKNSKRERGAPRWHSSTIRTMLENPYYAGIIRLRVSPPVYGKGKHEPLWDEATYRAILAEHRRRKETHKKYIARYPFTALVYCGVCGARVNRHGKKYKYIACTKEYKHYHRGYAEAVEILTGAIVSEFKKFQDVPYSPVDLSPLETRLAQIAADKMYVQDMTRRKIYSLDQGEREIAALSEEAEEIKYKIETAKEHESTRLEWHRNKQTNIDDLPALIRHGDPAKVNHTLMALIEKIIVTRDGVTVVWRAS